MMKYISLLLFSLLGLTACIQGDGGGSGHTSHESAPIDSVSTKGLPAKVNSADSQPNYAQELADWRTNRISALKRPRSWTTLVGLTWLKQGDNTFGSAAHCDVRINDAAPGDIGVWTVRGDSILFKVNQGADVRLSDQSRFLQGSIRADAHGDPDLFHLGALYWTIIKRSELYGVRVWDTTHHMRMDLTDIPHYNTDPSWKLKATILPAKDGETITMDNAVGQSIEYAIAGHVISSKDGIDINLIALDGGPDDLFLIFNDLTTDIETYPGGRYMYISRGDSLGVTVIDFNKAYNPPCAFTAFATCLLPPKSNFIGAQVLAGEKDYGNHDD